MYNEPENMSEMINSLETETETSVKSNLLVGKPIYKPFGYPWAYDAWLTQQRVHWLPEEVPLSDDVKDWHKNLTEPEKNVITQIFRFFTQADCEVNNCYRQGTEILTNKGWIDFRNLNTDHLVAQVSCQKIIEFVKPLKIHVQPAPDRLIRLYSERGFDITVTPDHDMVVLKDDKLIKVRAIDYPSSQDIYQPLSSFMAPNPRRLSDRERFLIAYQADARKSEFRGIRKKDCQIRFRLKREDKLYRLCDMLKRLDYSYTQYVGNDGVTNINVKLPKAFGILGKGFEWVDFNNIGVEWCSDFIEELSYWDSHIDLNGAIQYRNINENAADIVQVISTLSGRRASKSFVETTTGHHWLVSISHWNKVSTKRVKKDIIVPDKGENVYCVTVPSGIIIVRNNGKTIVSGNCYMKNYSQVFKPTEVLMMLSAFSNIETIHIAAYSHLLDTIGMPELEYSAFLEYKEMKDKYDYMQGFSVKNRYEIAKTLAAFGAFTEGLQLFASFAILLNFPRHNKMKGMGQIVSWSVRDETLHCYSVIKLFRTFIRENPKLWNDKLKNELTDICKTIVSHEDAFIDLAFQAGDIEGLTGEEVKQYIRFIADRRLSMLGLSEVYHIEKNPLPWLDTIMNAVEHTNFFENRSTEYSKSSTEGTWEDAFKD